MNIGQKYSIVFSVYNEEESLPLVFEELIWLDKQKLSGEVLFVNDGSTDNSLAIINKFKADRKLANFTIRYISFSKNFGHEAAMLAGIDNAKGDVVICLDADLQHPIRLIPEMVKQYSRGNDIVMMSRRKNKQNSLMLSLLIRFFYAFFNQISTVKIKRNVSDFFLISENIINLLRNNYRERHRFVRGIIQNIGFKKTVIEYDAPSRNAGQTKYSFTKLLIHTLNAVVSFSKKPLVLGIYFGFAFALLAIVLAVYTLIVYLFGNTPPSGYTTIVLFISFSFSILFFLVGIIGVYVGFVFDELKKRPIYIIEETDLELK
ncbi:MAG: glycosyltransferase family 2 protein [Bacteroidota bacterium]